MLVIAAVLSRLLTKDDYATYRQSMLVFTIALPLLLLGLPQSLLYFIPKAPGESRTRVSEILLILIGVGAGFSIFLLAGGASFLATQFSNPALKETLIWLAAYPLLMLPIAAAPPCLIATDRVASAAIFVAASRLVLMVAVVVPVLFC